MKFSKKYKILSTKHVKEINKIKMSQGGDILYD